MRPCSLFFPCHPFQIQNSELFSSQPRISCSGTLAEKVLLTFYPKPHRNEFESHYSGYVQNVDETIPCDFTLQCFVKITDLELSKSLPLAERRFSAIIGQGLQTPADHMTRAVNRNRKNNQDLPDCIKPLSHKLCEVP